MVLLSKTTIITGMGQEGTGGRVGRECQQSGLASFGIRTQKPVFCLVSLTVTGEKSVSSRLISVETGSG